MKNLVFRVYNSNRLEWHLGERTGKEPRRVLCGLVVQHDESFDQFNRLVVALAKSQDHRAFCGVFAFGVQSAEISGKDATDQTPMVAARGIL